MSEIWRWFAGGEVPYMNLAHCMRYDVFWIGVTIALDLAIASGYLLIALHWRKNERDLEPSPAKSALADMKKIFIFCGLCGYLFIPIKMFWPAWRLYDLFAATLAFFTWRYALGAHNLRVIYERLGLAGGLERDLEAAKHESAAKSLFLNALSHDLRTPLNSMNLHAHAAELCAEAGDAASLRESIAGIKAGAAAATRLLEQLLDACRLATEERRPERAPIRVRDLLTDSARGFGPRAAEKGLEIKVRADPELVIDSDPAMVLRIVENLIDNAVKFTAEGCVEAAAYRTPEGASIVVEDTGRGIAPAHRELIFEDFFQVNNRERDRTKGYGLGLAVASRLARNLGGSLGFEARTGGGSRFRLDIPAAEQFARSDGLADEGPRDALVGSAAPRGGG